MNRLPSFLALFTIALFAAVSPADAHLPPGEYGSFAAGFSHPLFGLDHILAMVAVGLWAVLLGSDARWKLPVTFVGVMLLGFLLALGGVVLPLVEPMILTSTIILGLLVALAARLDMRVCLAMVGVFAVFHGHAHGGELESAGAAAFGAGFVLATALLHAIGLGLGLAVSRIDSIAGVRGYAIVRGFGALTAIAGLGLAI